MCSTHFRRVPEAAVSRDVSAIRASSDTNPASAERPLSVESNFSLEFRYFNKDFEFLSVVHCFIREHKGSTWWDFSVCAMLCTSSSEHLAQTESIDGPSAEESSTDLIRRPWRLRARWRNSSTWPRNRTWSCLFAGRRRSLALSYQKMEWWNCLIDVTIKSGLPTGWSTSVSSNYEGFLI